MIILKIIIINCNFVLKDLRNALVTNCLSGKLRILDFGVCSQTWRKTIELWGFPQNRKIGRMLGNACIILNYFFCILFTIMD